MTPFWRHGIRTARSPGPAILDGATAGWVGRFGPHPGAVDQRAIPSSAELDIRGPSSSPVDTRGRRSVDRRHRVAVAVGRPDLAACRAETVRAVEKELVAHRGFRRFVYNRTNPAVATGLLLTVALVVAIIGGFLLGALAPLVRSRSGNITIDHDFSQWANDNTTRFAHDVLQVVTQLGGTEFVIVAESSSSSSSIGGSRAIGSRHSSRSSSSDRAC